jgi:hypothetical protein
MDEMPARSLIAHLVSLGSFVKESKNVTDYIFVTFL